MAAVAVRAMRERDEAGKDALVSGSGPCREVLNPLRSNDAIDNDAARNVLAANQPATTPNTLERARYDR